MDNIILNSAELIIWLCALVVHICAMSRFNNPQILLTELSIQQTNLLEKIKNTLKWNPGQQNFLLRPPRANTTVFRYRLYQFLYAFLAVLIYLLMFLQPDIREQVQVIILWFVPENMPKLVDAGPLVIAAFVILILPNVPPFRWADIKIRSMLYDRALIPAQQLREMHRLKMAPFEPAADIVQQVREIAVTEGFNASDIAYDTKCPTTKSLWSKCVILMEQIKSWQADDHYKTAFAALKEPDSERRSVEVVEEMQKNLIADARVCFDQLRKNNGDKSEELSKREAVFRSSCRSLLKKIYSLLAGVSLHSHYSDHERVEQFGQIGFDLEPEANGPIPDSNDMLILTIILCIFLVLPLSYKLGFIKAVMIGAIMFSAVMIPIFLAHVCPNMSDRKQKRERHGPNVIYPLLSGALAALFGFLIFYFGGQFLEPSAYCDYKGYERYINCTYPWSYLHGGIAFILAIRMGVGKYPDVNILQGMHRYRQWGDIKDAIICSICLLIIMAVFVIPELESLNPNRYEGSAYWKTLMRIVLVSFVLGFIVPTWYRAQNNPHSTDRRRDSKERKRFKEELESIRHGMIEE